MHPKTVHAPATSAVVRTDRDESRRTLTAVWATVSRTACTARRPTTRHPGRRCKMARPEITHFVTDDRQIAATATAPATDHPSLPVAHAAISRARREHLRHIHIGLLSSRSACWKQSRMSRKRQLRRDGSSVGTHEPNAERPRGLVPTSAHAPPAAQRRRCSATRQEPRLVKDGQTPADTPSWWPVQGLAAKQLPDTIRR